MAELLGLDGWYADRIPRARCRCDCGHVYATQLDRVAGSRCRSCAHLEHGGASRHPSAPRKEYSAWKGVRRFGVPYPPEWESFDAFLADVGRAPHPHCRLRRLNTAEPWSVANAHWKPTAAYLGSDAWAAAQLEDTEA